MGDGNNNYLHVAIKVRNSCNSMWLMQKENGIDLNTFEEVEREVMEYYNNLMGKTGCYLDGVDIIVLWNGPQLNNEKMRNLTTAITKDEIEKALNSIGDLKDPCIDGYGAYFFKKAWNIVKYDVVKAVQDFFVNGHIYKVANYTLVTLIPNSKEAKTIKEYRSISCCSMIYKITSKILIASVGRVMKSIIGPN